MDQEIDLGERLRELRTLRNMSQETLALAAGISPAYLGMLERGQKNPTVRVLGNLCSALRISLTDFFCQEKKQEETDYWTEQILYCLHDRSPHEKEALYKIIQQIVLLQKPVEAG